MNNLSQQARPDNVAYQKLLDPYTEEGLIDFLKARIGMRVQDHQLTTLRQTAVEASSRFGYGNAPQLLQALKSQKSLSPEMEFMIAGLTVGESYFFRDSRQFTFLEQVFLPALIRRKREQKNHTLRIWSAGCSDGQEIASIAILVRQQLPDIEDWSLHFLGTDINSEALSRAMKGEYRQWSMRAMPDAILKRYFSNNDSTYVLKPEIRNDIKYAWLNLTEDQFPSILTDTSMLDLVICRNVFIYLDDHVVDQVLKRFEACLARNGALMLGASDPNEIATRRMKLRESNGAFYYERREFGTGVAQASTHRKLTKASTKRKQPPATKPEPPIKKHPLSNTCLAESKRKIRELETGNQWNDVLDLIATCFQNGVVDSSISRSQAMAFANIGSLDEAEEICSAILLCDPEDSRAYFIHALILNEREDTVGAIHALRRALYVDREFIEAHRQMGLLLLHEGRHKRGLRELQVALEFAKKQAPAKELEFMTGVNCERIVTILENEINMYLQLQDN